MRFQSAPHWLYWKTRYSDFPDSEPMAWGGVSDSSRLIENYRYFENKINECGIDTNLLYKAITKLTIMDISTDRTYENPQFVCERLDSTGLDVTQTNLIRNWLGFLRSAS